MSTMNTSPAAPASSAGVSAPMMTLRERDALIAICIMASLADGTCDTHERDRIKQIVAELTGSTTAAETIYQRVQLYQTTMQAEAAELALPELREQAFEMAVGLVNADGVVSDAESAFLDRLAAELRIDPRVAASVVNATDGLAAASPQGAPAALPPVLPAGAASAALGAASAALGSGHAAAQAAHGTSTAAEVHSTIQNYAILTAALELLPQTLASMAIIPLQTKMVYAIGRKHGYALDGGHIKDLLATVGVGVTSQVFEGYARRLVGALVGKAAGGLLGKSAGRWAGTIGTTATGAAVTFGTTYALGKVAEQYYAGGRKLSAIDLQSLFTKELSGAKGMYETVLPQIQSQARALNPMNVLQMVRGG